MKTKIFFILFVFSCSLLKSQNDFQFSNQSFMRITYNPAATGQQKYWSASSFARYQWIDVNNAPVTKLFNIHKYFEKPNIGLGLSIVNDKLGLENNYYIKTTYSYHLKLKDQTFLSMGLGAGVISKSFDIASLQLENSESVALNSEATLKPDFDAGFEFNNSNWTIGIASTHITNDIFRSDNYRLARHYYFYSRYMLKEFNGVDLSFAYSLNSSKIKTQHEINVTAFCKRSMICGYSYRLNESHVFIAGMDINQRIRLLYSYDMNTGRLAGVSRGSHEILLQFKLGELKPYVHLSPRFFD